MAPPTRHLLLYMVLYRGCHLQSSKKLFPSAVTLQWHQRRSRRAMRSKTHWSGSVWKLEWSWQQASFLHFSRQALEVSRPSKLWKLSGKKYRFQSTLTQGSNWWLTSPQSKSQVCCNCPSSKHACQIQIPSQRFSMHIQQWKDLWWSHPRASVCLASIYPWQLAPRWPRKASWPQSG